jgi:hypothetical protein
MKEIDEILKIIDELNKFIDGYYILSGSWVLYFYRYKYPNFKYPLRTLDIDFVFDLYELFKRI